MSSYPKAPLDQTFPPYRSPMTGKFCDEVTYDIHVSDVKHIEKTVHELREPPCDNEHKTPCGEPQAECNYPDCDCLNSEIIMLSSGYAEAWRDGDVVSGGAVIYHED